MAYGPTTTRGAARRATLAVLRGPANTGEIDEPAPSRYSVIRPDYPFCA
jgi:hypothetical protein